MTTEFKIDRPGVYRRRDGSEVCLWPTFSRSPLRWFALFAESPMSYKDDGGFWIGGDESSAVADVVLTSFGKFSKIPATNYGHNRKRSIHYLHRNARCGTE